MTGHEPEGGEAACWAHLDLDGAAGRDAPGAPTRLDRVDDGAGADGAVWSLPHGGDLDANLVRLGPGGRIGEHVNGEVDVLVYVRAGGGRVEVDGHAHELAPDAVVLIPRGRRRALEAGPGGLSYLSIHRARTMGIGRPGHHHQ